MKEQLTRDKVLELLHKHVGEVKERFNVRSLGLFGSYAHNKPLKKSDIDILVEFEQPSFDNYMDLKFFLEKLFQKKVDLVMVDTLKPRLKPLIMQEVLRIA